MSIPVVPNLIPYVIMINVANVLFKAVIVLVKFLYLFPSKRLNTKLNQ